MKLTELFFAGLILLLASCVPNKKIVYLQKDDVNRDIPEKDSILRSYELEQYDYKIQPQDLISVQFGSLTPTEFDFFSKGSQSQNLNLSQGNAMLVGELVDAEGYIEYPVVGKVQVAGLTVFQVQDTLQRIAESYLDAPVIKVRLLNFRITILGEVNAEGTYTFFNNRISMMEAIGEAGGLGDLADRANVKLIRQRGGTTEVQYINLLEEDFMNSPYYYVHQNDVLIVPPLKQRPYRRYFGQNLSLVISSLSLLLLVVNLTRN